MKSLKINWPTKKIKISAIRPSPIGGRRRWSAEKTHWLTESRERFGQLRPVVVRRLPGRRAIYELIDGHRLYAINRALGETHVMALVLECDEHTAEMISLALNSTAEPLTRDELERRRRANERGRCLTVHSSVHPSFPATSVAGVVDHRHRTEERNAAIRSAAARNERKRQDPAGLLPDLLCESNTAASRISEDLCDVLDVLQHSGVSRSAAVVAESAASIDIERLFDLKDRIIELEELLAAWLPGPLSK